MDVCLIMPMASPFSLGTAMNALGKHFTLYLYESREGRHSKAVRPSILNKLSCLASLQLEQRQPEGRERKELQECGGTEADFGSCYRLFRRLWAVVKCKA